MRSKKMRSKKYLRLLEQATWEARINYRWTWDQIAKEFELSDRSDARKLAKKHCKKSGYFWPPPKAHGIGIDSYIDRQNGLSWEEIAIKHDKSASKIKKAASLYCQRNGISQKRI